MTHARQEALEREHLREINTELLGALERVRNSLQDAVNDAELNSGRLLNNTKRDADAAIENADTAIAKVKNEVAREESKP